MAMIRVAPVDVQVRTDWFDGTPTEITWGDERLPVTGWSRSATSLGLPGDHGPRTLFEVDTAGAGSP